MTESFPGTPCGGNTLEPDSQNAGSAPGCHVVRVKYGNEKKPG